MVFWAIVGVILGAYALRTRVRCRDWADEESLFTAAFDVCPRSIKVLQNYGTVQRRYENYSYALEL